MKKQNKQDQALLFARVGFSTRVLCMLTEYSEGVTPSKRTLRYWADGTFTPKNNYIINLAARLDYHLSQVAFRVLAEHEENKLILPCYDNDDDYWSATRDFPLPHECHNALLQRVLIFNTISAKPKIIEFQPYLTDDELMYSDNWERFQDWDSYVNIMIDLPEEEEKSVQ